MTVFERKQKIYRLNACSNCLALTHTVEKCRNSIRCFRCRADHHTMLHTHSRPTNSNQPAQQLPRPDHVILKMTAVADLEWSTKSIPVRLVINFNRDESAILGSFARQNNIPIVGINGKSCCKVIIRSRKTKKWVVVKCSVYDGEPSVTPKFNADKESVLNTFPMIETADPFFWRAQPIQMVLGAEQAPKLIYGAARAAEHGPAAFPTIFGWTFVGKVRTAD